MSTSAYSMIVVGTDGSSLAKPTVHRAATIAVTEGAELSILCAYSTMPRRVDAKNIHALGGDHKIDQIPGRQAAEKALKEAVAAAKEIGANVVAADLVAADASSALLHMCTERKADLLVVGAVRDRTIAGRLLGTVAETVLKKAPCDVLIVRPLPGEPMPQRAEDVVDLGSLSV